MSGVPMDVFKPVVLDLVRPENFDSQMECWRWLGQRVQVHEDTIYRIFGKGKRCLSVIDFDLADIILTKMHAAHLWHEPPLSEIYWDLPLECQNCDKYLEIHAGRNGGTRFCSRSCSREWKRVHAA